MNYCSAGPSSLEWLDTHKWFDQYRASLSALDTYGRNVYWTVKVLKLASRTKGVMWQEEMRRHGVHTARNFPWYFYILHHCCVKNAEITWELQVQFMPTASFTLLSGHDLPPRLTQKASSRLIHDHYIEKYCGRSLRSMLMTRSRLIHVHARASLTVCSSERQIELMCGLG